MKLDRWLAVTRNGSARITANKPDTKANEIAVHLLMSIPDALFFRPTIEAQVTLPPDAAPPLKLNAQVLEQVDEAIRSATGLDVTLSLAPPYEVE